MKIAKLTAVLLVAALLLAACGTKPTTTPTEQSATTPRVQMPKAPQYDNATEIVLSDSGITVDGVSVGTDNTDAVYTARDIVYYESGKDITYGEGGEKDAHTREEAAAHTVVHITKPGAYSVRGKLSLGQIAVDLGENAKDDPTAVVILILNGVDITCQVAPAVIFYNVFECGNTDAEKATKDVDTSAAGANVVIADGTTNRVNGAYVARIYKPDSVVLSEDKTKVEDAKKLHKYDAAFYSKCSMNIFGGTENTGVLNIDACNEGLDSELHLTINGGNINIKSGNDGINTNEDGLSVTTVNGGNLTILVTGETGEGDGIDSNGWLVINGGTVLASACSNSADAGIDSDKGIHINGGTVLATGHMLDRIEDGGQNYAVFNFAQKKSGSETITMKCSDGKTVFETKPENAYSILVYSSAELKVGTYTLYSDDKQLAGSTGGMMGGLGMWGGGGNRQERPSNMQPPEGFTPPDGGMPAEGIAPPEDGNWPEGLDPSHKGERPQRPEGGTWVEPGDNNPGSTGIRELSPDFVIKDGGNMFSGVSYMADK